MDLEDLRTELSARAREVDGAAGGRMAGVRAKAATRRRRKAAVTLTAVVACAGVVAGVPVVSGLVEGSGPAETATPFPAQADGGPRLAAAVGAQGDETVILEFTPEDAAFVLDLRCDTWPPQSGSVASLMVDGKPVRWPCSAGRSEVPTVDNPPSPRTARDFWEKHGVINGRPVEVTLERSLVTTSEYRKSTNRYETRLATLRYQLNQADDAMAAARTNQERRDAQRTADKARRGERNVAAALDELHQRRNASVDSPEILAVAAYALPD